MEKSNSQHVDLSTRRVARVYAEALLRAATSQNAEDQIVEEYNSLVSDLLDGDARVEALLSQAALGRKAREELIQKVFASRAHPLLTNFLLVLNQHDRLDLLRPGLVELRKLYDEQKGRTRVQVVSAVALDSAQQEKLTRDLREAFAVEPILNLKVDPDILGGLKIRIGDWLYDASVRTRIDNLRHQILARSSHEIQSGRDRFSSN